MTVLLHLSDPHFGTERPAVVEALLRLGAQTEPALVVLSGDITQRATRAQFATARAFLDKLAPAGRVARLVIPGNHDIPLVNLALRLAAPYARHRAAFGHALEPVFASPRLLVLGLNTTRPWRHQDGAVSPRQVERIAQQLEAARRAHPAQWRVVVTHQPIAVIRPEDAHNLLHGHAAARERWAQAGADVVLGGHIHLPYVTALHGTLPGHGGKLWAVQAGTAVSTRLRREAGNSVNVLRFGAPSTPDTNDHAVVERWDYDEAAQGFARRCADMLQR